MPLESDGLVVKNTASFGTPEAVVLDADAGQPAFGGLSSNTFTVKEHELVRLAKSLTLHDTGTVTANGKNDPSATVQVGPDWIPALSDEEMLYDTKLPVAFSVTLVMLAHVMVGGVVSTIDTLKLQVPTLPNVSVALQTTVVFPTGKFVGLAGVQEELATPLVSDAEGL